MSEKFASPPKEIPLENEPESKPDENLHNICTVRMDPDRNRVIAIGGKPVPWYVPIPGQPLVS